jgi:hypothetical protein
VQVRLGRTVLLLVEDSEAHQIRLGYSRMGGVLPEYQTYPEWIVSQHRSVRCVSYTLFRLTCKIFRSAVRPSRVLQ